MCSPLRRAGLCAGRSAETAVLLVIHGFEPLVGRVLAGDFHGQVGKPAVLCGAVPVLHTDGDVDHVACLESTGGLAPLLIPAAAADAQQDLAAALGRVVDVPVVAAAGSKVTLAMPTCSLLRRAR